MLKNYLSSQRFLVRLCDHIIVFISFVWSQLCSFRFTLLSDSQTVTVHVGLAAFHHNFCVCSGIVRSFMFFFSLEESDETSVDCSEICVGDDLLRIYFICWRNHAGRKARRIESKNGRIRSLCVRKFLHCWIREGLLLKETMDICWPSQICLDLCATYLGAK